MELKIENSVVAIDGYSSCGKSTLAKDLAKVLSYRFIDSGAMYRACTLYFLDHEIKFDDQQAILNALDNIHIQFELIDGKSIPFLNGKDVKFEIRSLRVSKKVSEVSAIKVVRVKMVELQQKMGAQKRIVMDGRDIGSVVFPDAKHKFFVTSELNIRIDRRLNELQVKGYSITREDIKENLLHRDHIDSTRKESPLTCTDEHIIIDNSYLNRKEQVMVALQHMKENLLKQ